MPVIPSAKLKAGPWPRIWLRKLMDKFVVVKQTAWVIKKLTVWSVKRRLVSAVNRFTQRL